MDGVEKLKHALPKLDTNTDIIKIITIKDKNTSLSPCTIAATLLSFILRGAGNNNNNNIKMSDF